MIAACPKCAARYRLERERLKPEGLKIRCSRCESVFRVRSPAEVAPSGSAAEAPRSEAPPQTAAAPQAETPAPSPSEPTRVDVIVATPDADLGKQAAETLHARGLLALVVGDGVEAMLEIQRRLPSAVVLAANLPRMFGFQICEIVKRNESLQHIRVVLIGAIHHKDRHRRPPHELYGADSYLEEPDLPEALVPALRELGLRPDAASEPPSPADAPSAPSAPAPPAAASTPGAPAAPSAPAAPAPVAASAAGSGDELAAERSRADRLARIIVSDIVLYNEARFNEACAAGKVREMLEGDLAEGRSLFRDRIDERVRAEKDHLMEELLRVAKSRTGS